LTDSNGAAPRRSDVLGVDAAVPALTKPPSSLDTANLREPSPPISTIRRQHSLRTGLCWSRFSEGDVTGFTSDERKWVACGDRYKSKPVLTITSRWAWYRVIR